MSRNSRSRTYFSRLLSVATLAMGLAGCASVTEPWWETCGVNPPCPWVFPDARKDENGNVVYEMMSQYMELEQESDDAVVLSRAIVTLGPERLPEDFEFPDTQWGNTRYKVYAGGGIEYVMELFLINQSDKPIDVELISMRSHRVSREFNTQYTIPPQGVVTSPPIILVRSKWRKDHGVAYTYRYNDELYEVEGDAVRMTTQEVADKYGE